MLIGTRNRLAGLTPTGGSWRSSQPAANATIMPFRKAALSTNADATSSIMVFDMGAEYDVGLLTLSLTNIRAGATIRLRLAASEAGLTSAPTTDQTFDAWHSPDTPTTNLGQNGRPIHMPQHICPFTVDGARWARIDVSDAGNPDGGIKIGYVGVWEVWQPANGIDYGNAVQLISGTVGQQSLGGVPYFDRRPNQRVFPFTTGWMEKEDAYRALDIMRERDLDLPLAVVPWEDEPTSFLREAFVGRAQKLDGWAMGYEGYDRRSTGWIITEYEAA